jgi:hypothetical protein
MNVLQLMQRWAARVPRLQLIRLQGVARAGRRKGMERLFDSLGIPRSRLAS